MKQVIIDGVEYQPKQNLVLSTESQKILNDIYFELFNEAFYGLNGKPSQDFAGKVWLKMKKLNLMLKFLEQS